MPVSRPAALVLAACSALSFAAPVPAPSPEVPAVQNSSLDAPLFYQLLIGEIELRDGDSGSAYQVLLDAARKTRDERLFRRATEVALQLTRSDPFDTGLEPFDDLFRGFFRPVRLDRELPQFKMDVKENNKAYTVHADLPGVKKEDIHVSIEGNTVAISAETRTESEQKEGEKVLKRERSYGKIYRSFSLASDIDQANATAKYADGVLELVLPKKTAAASKRLTVE